MSTRDTCLTFYVYESASLCIHRNGALILFHCLKLDVNQGCIYNWDSNSKHLSIDVNVAFFSSNQFQSISWFLTFLAKPHTQKKENFPASVYLYTITLNTSSLWATCVEGYITITSLFRFQGRGEQLSFACLLCLDFSACQLVVF